MLVVSTLIGLVGRDRRLGDLLEGLTMAVLMKELFSKRAIAVPERESRYLVALWDKICFKELFISVKGRSSFYGPEWAGIQIFTGTSF